MRIAFLAAGAAGMYCGSCIRDNSVARALKALGYDVLFVPLYTPLKVDGADVSIRDIYYGGINVFLQQKSDFFRKTPRLLDRLFDSRTLLNFSSKFAGMTKAEDLGELTVSTLQGADGKQVKELERLGDWLASDYKPDIINVPNVMFAGAAVPLREKTGAKIVCTLSGEDVFLEALIEPYKSNSLELLRKTAQTVDHFIAVSKYCADFMSEYLHVDREKIDVIPLGVDPTEFGRQGARPVEPFTVGYMARLDPVKGFHILCEAFRLLREKPGTEDARLLVAGWMGSREKVYFNENVALLKKWGLADAFEYRGEVSFQDKLRLLDDVSVLSVPTVYRDPKGLFILEALAHGVPVVMPEHGAFPEMIEATGGGLLCNPEDPENLAEKLHQIAMDREQADRLALGGREIVRKKFTDTEMARRTVAVYESVLQGVST